MDISELMRIIFEGIEQMIEQFASIISVMPDKISWIKANRCSEIFHSYHHSVSACIEIFRYWSLKEFIFFRASVQLIILRLNSGNWFPDFPHTKTNFYRRIRRCSLPKFGGKTILDTFDWNFEAFPRNCRNRFKNMFSPKLDHLSRVILLFNKNIIFGGSSTRKLVRKMLKGWTNNLRKWTGIGS